mgnify:CR=1 FL=1
MTAEQRRTEAEAVADQLRQLNTELEREVEYELLHRAADTIEAVAGGCCVSRRATEAELGCSAAAPG